MKKYDVIVVGGGLAGLTAAIHLSQSGHQVLVLEKQHYPHHKVCGEYVSNEVMPYLNRLGISFDEVGAVGIDTLKLSTLGGKQAEMELPLGGKGISRYCLDNSLYRKALGAGVIFQFEIAISVEFKDSNFEVTTNVYATYTSKLVIGAYGKRGNMDRTLKREFVTQKSYWLAVKNHYHYDALPENVVELHNFPGGYGGLSRTETGAVNFCYLVSYESFQKQAGIASFNANVVAKNPFLNDFLENATPIFDEPLTIAQISFHPKKAVEDHILMCGDTAGLIHPLCGNGMAMAIHSAKIASELIDGFLKKHEGNSAKSEENRVGLERNYQNRWNRQFKRRLWMGRRLQSLLLNPRLSSTALSLIINKPGIMRKIVQNTHGKAIA